MTEAGAQTVDQDTPTRALSDDDLFVRLQSEFREDWDHHLKWVDGEDDHDKGAREDFDFAALRQWDEEALAKLRKENRPASVFDRIAPMIDAVCGSEVANRQEVRYIPRELGDAGVSELITSAAQWFRDQSDAEDEESDAFRDMVISGRGCIETRIDYDVNPDGEPIVTRVNPLEVCADRDACKPNYADAKRVWRVRRMSIDAALNLIPDADPADLHAGWASSVDDKVQVDRLSDDYNISDTPAKPRPECVIIECQWWELEPFVRFVNPVTGQIEEMEEAKFNLFIERLGQMDIETLMASGIVPPTDYVTQYRRVYRRAFIGKKILSKPPLPVDNEFTYNFITGKKDANRSQFIGLVKAMKDPARWTNKLFSQIMNILNSNAKGGVMAERGAFEDDRKAAQDWAKAAPIIFTSPGAIQNGRIQPRAPAPFPDGQSQMLQFSMNAMTMVTGINQEMLGMRETDQPGVVEYQRKQAGLTILAPFFDSLRRYRKMQGRLMLGLIQRYLSDGRLVRIAGDEYGKYVPLMKELTAGEYDIIVDDAPTAPNAKERNWAIIQQMFPILQPLMQGNPQLVVEALRNSPLPESFVQKATEAITKPPEPNPQAEIQQQLAYAQAVSDIQKKQADTEDAQASAIGRKARALKDISDATAPFILGDIPSPAMPMPGQPLPVAPPFGFPPQPALDEIQQRALAQQALSRPLIQA